MNTFTCYRTANLQTIFSVQPIKIRIFVKRISLQDKEGISDILGYYLSWETIVDQMTPILHALSVSKIRNAQHVLAIRYLCLTAFLLLYIRLVITIIRKYVSLFRNFVVISSQYTFLTYDHNS